VQRAWAPYTALPRAAEHITRQTPTQERRNLFA